MKKILSLFLTLTVIVSQLVWFPSTVSADTTIYVKSIFTGNYSWSTYFLMSDGTVKDCGNNSGGELGIGNTTNQSSPVTVPELSNVKQLGVGDCHVLALLNDGTVKAWGGNPCSPVTVPGLFNVTQVCGGFEISFALMNDGTVKAWGYNNCGQLGIGNTTDQNSPVTIPGLSNVKQIAAGDYSAYALMNDGTVKAWGYNGDCELGIDYNIMEE